MNAASASLRTRVLLLAPTARDASLTAEILSRNGMAAHACTSSGELEAQLALGVGAVLLAEEMLLVHGAHAALTRMLAAQPRWSDVPVLLMTRAGADSPVVLDAVDTLGNVTLLERPLRVAALVSTVRAALRARDRQYQIESHLAELERARRFEAEQAQRKDEFLAMLAHELRNPLAPIRNALHILDMDDSDPERRVSLRRMMLRQVNHMVRLVDDLVEASRLSRGKIELRREHMDLRDILRAAVDVARPHVSSGAHELAVSLPEAPLPLNADPVRLTQVFGNLLNNAAKYGRPGGRIALEARREGDMAMVAVADDGVGIEPDLLPHVFELFTQGKRESHRVQEGLGIGLALVRSLVQAHGGSVAAHSDGRDRGARFEVRLPLARPLGKRDAPASGADEGTLPGNGNLRVLVADDNVDAANSLAMVLEALRMEHRVVHDGASALAAARDFAPHAVLLDIGMPEMDGYEVARRLRADPRHAGVLLVAVTGWSEAQDLQRAQDAGFDQHFAKPADVQTLTILLESVRERVRDSKAGSGSAAA